MKYFITYNGQTIGPMTKEQLASYAVTPNTPVCTVDNQMWQPLYTYPELMEQLNNRQYTQYTPNPEDVNTTGKDKVLAGVLAIILGGLGIQYFYIGKVSAGIITILLSLITCGFWSFITLIQGILMITMTQAQFERKYVLSTSTFPVF